MRFFLMLTCLFAMLGGNVRAETIRDFDAFGRLPIVHDGRLKPMDSFARVMLKTFSGEETLDGKPAIVWLADTLFDPAGAPDQPLFKITNQSVLSQLGLRGNQKLYSLNNLHSGLAATREQAVQLLQKDPQSLTADQKEFLTLHDHAEAYTQLLRSLSMVLPLNLDIPDHLKVREDGKPPVYLDLVALNARIAEDVRSIVERRGADISTYDDDEKQLAMLSFQLSLIREGGSQNSLLKIMPEQWAAGQKNTAQLDWYSPWAMLLSGEGSPQGRKYLALWRDMAAAYRQDYVQSWDASTDLALDFAAPYFSGSAFWAEIVYHGWSPYRWAIGLYCLACLLFLGALNPRFNAVRKDRFFLAGIAGAGAGLACHAAGIGFRMFILERPPVGTLYESVLFVALVAGFAGVISGCKRSSVIPVLGGAMAAFLLLGIAPVAEPDPESLDVLTAVLNTGFWLGTHVLIITAGYGLCILLAMVAHAFLITRLLHGPSYAGLPALSGLVHRLSLAALLFTAVGTILGGIWADQSWGRFWGWDPKENGALLIVLWIIWAQHGRLSGHLRPVAFTAMMGVLNIIVGLAWFGVNLLNVGLHSYGFTSGLAFGLGIFCAVQLAVIGGLWAGIRFKESRGSV